MWVLFGCFVVGASSSMPMVASKRMNETRSGDDQSRGSQKNLVSVTWSLLLGGSAVGRKLERYAGAISRNRNKATVPDPLWHPPHAMDMYTTLVPMPHRVLLQNNKSRAKAFAEQCMLHLKKVSDEEKRVSILTFIDSLVIVNSSLAAYFLAPPEDVLSSEDTAAAPAATPAATDAGATTAVTATTTTTTTTTTAEGMPLF